MWFKSFLAIAGFLLISLPLSALGGELRVMSFNVRYANPNDGGNAWPLRKELLFATIEKFGPDLLGTQEVELLQADELKQRLAGYEMVGVARNDGKDAGERSAIFFKTDRFEKIRGGDFWLSETPEKIGSKGWDAQLPRICTWVELRDNQAGGRPVVFFNTHFDHVGKQARLESAKLLKMKLVEFAGDKPVIVSGDFNAVPDSAPYKALVSDALVHTFAEMHPHPTTQDFSVHGFTGKNKAGAIRIDWILRSNAFTTKSAKIDRSDDGGRYPSDHFPVSAVLCWKE